MLHFVLFGLAILVVVLRFALNRPKGLLPGPKSYPLFGNFELVLKRNGREREKSTENKSDNNLFKL
jgi:hypothetical protein